MGQCRRNPPGHAVGNDPLLAQAPPLPAARPAHRRHFARVRPIAVKNALLILDALVAGGLAVEVRHRSKRRLFGLTGLTPLRDAVRPPYRPDPELGRGRPRVDIEEDLVEVAASPLPPLTPIERRSFDYTALKEAMAHLDAVVWHTDTSLLAEERTCRWC